MAALLYHHVGPVREDACRGLTVEPKAFARQMTALSAMGYETVSTSTWTAHVRSNTDVPKYPMMITFDDAYADLPAHAFPALLKHGFTATVFVPTSLVGGSIPCNPSQPAARLPIMSAEAITEWSARGIEFGAHSRSHSDLTTLAPGAVLDEMEGSRDALADIIGRAVTAFAYPFGRSDDVSRRLAETLFDAAFTIEEGTNDSATPLSTLRRSMVQHGDSVVDVCLRARFGKSVLERVRTATRGGPLGADPTPT